MEDARIKRQACLSVAEFTQEIVDNIGIVGVPFLAGILYFRGQVAFGAIIAAGYLANGVFSSLQESFSAYISAKSTTKLNETMLQHLQVQAAAKTEDPQTIIGRGTEVNLGGQVIKYPDLDFTIKAGEKVLLTGPSGCGKSSLFKLLLGQIEPSKGQLTYLDSEGKEIQNPARSFEYLPQAGWIFPGTVADNITMYDAKKQTLVTVGGSEAIDLVFRTLLDPGDEVIIPEPSFVCYEPLTVMADGVPVIINTKNEDNFRLKASDLRAAITPKTKLLVLPFPNNPTGAIMEREDLEKIAEVIKEHNIFILSDEIYCELTYGNKNHVSIAEIDGMYERTIVVNGFSKSYAMTGWRLGYALGPVPVIAQMTKLHQYGIMSAPTTAQYAAIEALRNGDRDVEMMRGEYDMRRRLVVDSFNAMGLTCFEPLGAFYVFPCIKSTGLTSEEFCTRLIVDKHVAVVPGTAFGESGEGFVRVSYSYSIKHLKIALERIKEFLDELKKG